MTSGGEREIAIYTTQRAHEEQLNDSTSRFEHALIAPLFLLNGGAAVAFLTLLGAASSGDSTLHVSTVLASLALEAWSLGLLTTAVAVRAGYLAQRDFLRATTSRRRMLEHALAGPDSVLIGLLAPLVDTVRADLERAASHQRAWLWLSTLALVWFIIGVTLAAAAVL